MGHCNMTFFCSLSLHYKLSPVTEYSLNFKSGNFSSADFLCHFKFLLFNHLEKASSCTREAPQELQVRQGNKSKISGFI